MKQFIRVSVKNYKEERLLKKTFKGLPVRTVKGFNSIIISPKTESIKKGNNKYLQLLSALSTLQKVGFKNSARIIKF